MGTLRKTGQKWRAEVCVKGHRASRTCRTKAEAMAWILQQEESLQLGPDHTVAEMLDRYKDTHASRKVRNTSEERRCERLARDLGNWRLRVLTPDDLAAWRDRRLREVSPATVRRDWNLLNHAFNVALREWGWLQANPLATLKRPAPPKPRCRVWADDEVERLLHCAGWPGDSLQARVGDCLLFALETAMRAGEICRVRPAHDHGRYLHIPLTKNGHPRDVPLSARAREILDRVGGRFGINERQLDALFRKARDRAALDDLTFHDSRRTALTQLSKRLDALELARVSGHRDLRILLDTYYAPKVEDLADKLD